MIATIEYEGSKIACRDRTLNDMLLHGHRATTLELAYIAKHNIAQEWLDTPMNEGSSTAINSHWLSAMASNFVLISIQVDRDVTECKELLAVLCDFDTPIDEWLAAFSAWLTLSDALRDATIEVYHKAEAPPEV